MEKAVRNAHLRDDIIDYLTKENAGYDVNIYCNGHCYKMDTKKGRECKTKKGSRYRDMGEQELDIKFSNPDTVTMTFEGELYTLLNYGRQTMEDLNAIGHKYGLYFEQGHAWSLAVRTALY